MHGISIRGYYDLNGAAQNIHQGFQESFHVLIEMVVAVVHLGKFGWE